MNFKEAIELMKKGQIVEQTETCYLYKIEGGMLFVDEHLPWDGDPWLPSDIHTIDEIEYFLKHDYEKKVTAEDIKMELKYTTTMSETIVRPLTTSEKALVYISEDFLGSSPLELFKDANKELERIGFVSYNSKTGEGEFTTETSYESTFPEIMAWTCIQSKIECVKSERCDTCPRNYKSNCTLVRDVKAAEAILKNKTVTIEILPE